VIFFEVNGKKKKNDLIKSS